MVRKVAAILVCLFVATGCSSSSGTPSSATQQPSSTGGEQVVEVTIQNLAFSPQTITVAPGTTVRWTQKDSAPHTVTATSGQFDSGSLSQGKTYSFKFATASTYNYYCIFHASMNGTVIVK